jgi:hypothetical protein
VESLGPDIRVAQSNHASYFVLNIWEERLEGGTEWRGELLHVDSGSQIRFDDWPELVELIAQGLRDPGQGALSGEADRN